MDNTPEKSDINFEHIEKVTLNPEIISAGTAITKLESEGHQISDYAKNMLEKIDWKEVLKTSYELVSISVEELFHDKEMHTYGEINAKAQEIGLDFVPPALAPHIRLNYEKSGDWVTLSMKPIRDYDNNPSIFYFAARGPESWLRNFDGRDSERWYNYNKFFFIRK